MGMHLHVCPKVPPMSRKEFTRPYSIALDGYVHGGPWFDKKGPCINFNHHEGVDRLATRSTCAQVYLAIRQGLFLRFHDKAFRHHAHVYVNDCDEDVCMAWFLLKHGRIVERGVNLLLNRLVFMEDFLDTTSGAYPLPPDYPVLQEVNWVFEPYQQFRFTGGVYRRSEGEYRDIIDIVCNRITEYIHGRGKTVALDTRYERLGGGENWSLIRKIGAQARTGMFADGVHAYVSVQQRTRQNVWDYAIGRTSIFVDFDIQQACKRLNKVEGLVDNPDRWGGGNTTGGSPRIAGSKLPPEKVEEIMNQSCVCENRNGNRSER